MNKLKKTNLSLLVVDDDTSALKELGEILKSFFDHVYLAKDGVEAFEQYTEKKPDIILTDLNMPRCNGMELAKRIIEQDAAASIIAMTANNELTTVTEAFEIGFENLILKPVQLRKLFDVLKRVSHKIHLQNELSKKSKYYEEIYEIAKVSSFEYSTATGANIIPDTNCVKMFNLTEDESITQEHFFKQFLSPEDLKELLSLQELLLLNKKELNRQYRFNFSDGSSKYIDITGNPVLDERGNILKCQTIFKDITALKQTELSLMQETDISKTLQELSLLIKRADTNLSKLAKKLIRSLSSVLECEHGCIISTSKATENFSYRTTKTKKNDYKTDPTLDLCFKCIKHIKEIKSVTLNNESAFVCKPSKSVTVEFNNTVHFPVILNRDLIATIQLANKPNGFSQNDLATIERFATLFSVGYQNVVAQENIEFSEEKFKAVFDSAQEGIIIASISEQRFVYVNEKICSMLKYSPEALKNLWVDDIHPPEKLKEIKAIFSKQTEGINPNQYGLPILCSDGTVIDSENHSNMFKVANKTYLAGFFKDITQRLKQEEQLRLFRRIVDISNDLMAFIDKDFIYRAINDAYAALFDIQKELILNKPVSSFYSKEAYNAISGCMKKALKGEKSTCEVWLNFDTGNRYFQYSYYPFYSAKHTIEGIVVSAHDLTKRKNTEDKLKELTVSLENKVNEKLSELREKDTMMLQQGRFVAMGEMLSMIAHQWRQPISAISSSAVKVNMQKDFGEITDEELDEQMHFIQAQCQQMSHTINDFMDFFKPDKNKELFTMSQCVNHINKMVVPQLKSRNINLSIQYDENIKIYGVNNEFEHVLLNLISNARDAIGDKEIENKEILVNAYADNDTITVTVEDNAGGVPETIIDKIFDPYFTTKPKGVGTGIGLYMTRTIIERHFDGTINVRNTEKGALFSIIVPNKGAQ